MPYISSTTKRSLLDRQIILLFSFIDVQQPVLEDYSRTQIWVTGHIIYQTMHGLAIEPVWHVPSVLQRVPN